MARPKKGEEVGERPRAPPRKPLPKLPLGRHRKAARSRVGEETFNVHPRVAKCRLAKSDDARRVANAIEVAQKREKREGKRISRSGRVLREPLPGQRVVYTKPHDGSTGRGLFLVKRSGFAVLKRLYMTQWEQSPLVAVRPRALTSV